MFVLYWVWDKDDTCFRGRVKEGPDMGVGDVRGEVVVGAIS